MGSKSSKTKEEQENRQATLSPTLSLSLSLTPPVAVAVPLPTRAAFRALHPALSSLPVVVREPSKRRMGAAPAFRCVGGGKGCVGWRSARGHVWPLSRVCSVRLQPNALHRTAPPSLFSSSSAHVIDPLHMRLLSSGVHVCRLFRWDHAQNPPRTLLPAHALGRLHTTPTRALCTRVGLSVAPALFVACRSRRRADRG